jgi:hypothetical protein
VKNLDAVRSKRFNLVSTAKVYQEIQFQPQIQKSHSSQVIKTAAEAIERKDWDTYRSLLAQDVHWYTPIRFDPIVGREVMLSLQTIVLGEILQDFRYTEVAESAERSYLFFTSQIAGKTLEGVDILRVNSEGLINEFRVEVRPLDAAQALGEATIQALVEKGIQIPAS